MRATVSKAELKILEKLYHADYKHIEARNIRGLTMSIEYKTLKKDGTWSSWKFSGYGFPSHMDATVKKVKDNYYLIQKKEAVQERYLLRELHMDILSILD